MQLEEGANGKLSGVPADTPVAVSKQDADATVRSFAMQRRTVSVGWGLVLCLKLPWNAAGSKSRDAR